uniref:Uncharacterized protein n=1 Tax=Oryza rufipogon TaxID=4529 RepID=A0A0E0P601_ORYRU
MNHRPSSPINSRRAHPISSASELEVLSFSLHHGRLIPSPRSISSIGAPSAESLRYELRLDEVIPFLPFPLSFSHRHNSSPPPHKPAGTKVLSTPFRPSPSFPRLATTFPGCASLGNTLGHRRRDRSITGAPAPLLSLSLSLLFTGRREGRSRREEEEGEKKKKKIKRQPVVFRGSDNQVAYLRVICVGARQ